jgi:hypothetical protein
MSNTRDRLDTAAFPTEYAETLIHALEIGPANFPTVKDALYHFRSLDNAQAGEVMREMAERFSAVQLRQADPAHRAQFQKRDDAKGYDH